MEETAIDRFLQRLIVTSDNCWEWQGQRLGNGYGRFNYRSTQELAHRFSFRTFKGEIPKDKIVCHKCDNKPCVNPSHLWLGTYKDNTQDGIKKGRIIPWNAEIRAKIPVLTHCRRGIHELTPKDKAARRCLACQRKYHADYMSTYKKGISIERN